MNVCIITVYNSENCGSFLQAYSLYNALKKMDCNVSFLERKISGTSHAPAKHLVESVKRLAKGRFWEAYGEWRRYRNFCEAIKQFSITPNNHEALKNIDCIVIGSDTVWNFDSKYFWKNRKRYLGIGLPVKNVVSYAASVGNTKYSKFYDSEEVKEALRELNKISVRDVYTKKLVEEITNKEAVLVADPTMLLSKEEFIDIEPEINEKNYILVYHFGKLTQQQKKQIIELKEKIHKKVISFGEYNDWCDANIVYNPHLFLSYFHNADFIVTNTFHGTIFSLLYEKNFADYGGNKQKVKDLLTSVGLDEQLCDEKSDLKEIYNRHINYETVNKKMEELKKESLKYLESVIGEN